MRRGEADTPRILAGLELGERERLAALGVEALRAGRIALLSMAGGMATRFGGGAKACAKLLPDREDSFLSFCCRHLLTRERQYEARVPFVVMTSFATNEAISSALDKADWYGLDPSRRHMFTQSVFPRVQPDAKPLYLDPAARTWPDTLTCCAPGHGDTLGRLRSSGLLAKLREQGVEHILIANIDNIGATIDPVLVGAHIESAQAGARISVEVVARNPGEAGGCVARINEGPHPGPQIVESFRLPSGTSLDDYPHFNTNTLWFCAEALVDELELEWFAVEKKIKDPAGQDLRCLQFESLIGQATALLATRFLEVPRALRFLPIKKRADLNSARNQIAARLDADLAADGDQLSLLAFS